MNGRFLRCDNCSQNHEVKGKKAFKHLVNQKVEMFGWLSFPKGKKNKTLDFCSEKCHEKWKTQRKAEKDGLFQDPD